MTGKIIITLRTDNGGEYTSDMFKDYCINAGIKRELTVPYNPQQNGVVERKNRTIVEAARAMLFDQNIETSFWAEASRTIVYIQNRCPHSLLDNKTLEEACTGNKPDISHLRIFGCPVYIHVPKEKRSKLEPSVKKGVFVGYSETSKAYRVYILGQRQIELSRDVIFEEDTTFRRSKSSNELEHQDPPTSTDEDPTPEIQRETLENAEHEVQDLPLEEHYPETRKRRLWAKKMLQEAENYAAPKGTFRESKRPNLSSSYAALMSETIDAKPSCVGDALKHQVWKDAMSEEYQSILKNDV